MKVSVLSSQKSGEEAQTKKKGVGQLQEEGKNVRPSGKTWRRIFTAAVLLGAVFVKWTCPALRDGLCDLLIGPEGNAAQQAFYALQAQLESGQSVEQAIVVFCQEVLHEA